MVLVGRSLSNSSSHAAGVDKPLDSCRVFMDEMKGFVHALISEICPAVLQACRVALDRVDLDADCADGEVVLGIFSRVKGECERLASMYAARGKGLAIDGVGSGWCCPFAARGTRQP